MNKLPKPKKVNILKDEEFKELVDNAFGDDWEKRFDENFNRMIEDWGETSLGEKNMKKELRKIKRFIQSELDNVIERIEKELLNYPKNFVDKYGEYDNENVWSINYDKYIKDKLSKLK